MHTFRVFLFAAALLLNMALSIRAQSNTCANGDQLVINTSTKVYQCLTPGTLPAGTSTSMIVANASVTGTTLNRLAKLTGAPSTAVITTTTDTDTILGIVTSGAGTTGNATIAVLGQANCDFDGATTAGNFFVNSTTTNGKCHDGGSTYPTSSAVLGRILSTNGGAGTYQVELMTPDVVAAAATSANGKAKPGGLNKDYQYNNSNVFGGGRLKQEATDIVSQDGGVTTPQTFKVYGNDNGATTSFLQLVGNTTQHTITSAGTDVKNLRIGVGATAYWEWGTGAVTFNADRQYNLGSSSSRLNEIRGYDSYIGNNLNFEAGPRLNGPSGTGWLHLQDSTGTANAIRLGFGDPGSSGPAINRPANAKYLVSTIANDTTTRTFYVDAGRLFTSAQFDKVNATLANVTGLVSETLTAGRTYSFAAELFVDADVTGGSKYAIAGTATATAIKYEVIMTCDASNLLVITSRQTALAGSVGQAGCTAGLTRITGTITVNAAGTLAVQFAQNTANGTSSVLTMSKFEVHQLDQ